MIILSIPYLDNDYVLQKEGEYPNYWKEFRLDYSKDFQFFPPEIINEKTILTIRSEKEGGKHKIDITDKIEFYKKIISEKNCLCDLEINEVTNQDILHISENNLILSYHDFSEDIDFTKLREIVKRSNLLSSRFLKIAVNISKYSDLIKLSQVISESKKSVIFAGMGKLGKISRILFRHLGADATFIGLTDNPTAEGQLTPEEAEFFKLSSISNKTQIGGIIGGNQVEHSLGIKYYNDLFTKEKLDAIYLPFSTDDIDDLWNWINEADINFFGFSITMPFKKIIGAKKQLSAVNLFLPKTDKMLNTDLDAFVKSIEILKLEKDDTILIIGSGATAEIALKAFQTFDNIIISSRNEFSGKKLAKDNDREFIQLENLRNYKYDVIINCTHLGTKNEDIIELFNLKLSTKVIELPYTQKNTLLINRCIENKIDYIDGKRFWKLQAKIQQQKFIKAILQLRGKCMKLNPVELVIKKKTGKELTQTELEYFVNSYINNEIPEYQMSAMLMAIYFQSMKIEEIQTLTKVYIESGKQITFPKSDKTVDKHSTGGVGDKITIMLAPIVAACGGKIPMISGRGLGHTGGTLDKLESIPGFRTDFNDTEFKEIIEKVGFCIISQSEELVPADRRIYALRDVTGTVESLPLITASIMSKKIAEGAQNLVIDLKIGSGAFIKDIEIGNELANLLIKTGEKFGQKVSVVFSNMNSPLGRYIGNALEIKETIEYLQGKDIPDIDILTKTLAIEMLLLSEVAATELEAMTMIENVIKNGKALKYFKDSIAAQGGNPEVCDDTSLLPQARYKIPIISQRSGWINSINSQQIGYALIEIGAGRKTLDSKLDYSSGAYLTKKIGDKISKDETIGYVFCNNKSEGNNIITKILNSYELINEEVQNEKMILKILK